MKVGFVQFAPVFADIEGSIRKIDELIKDATSADLLVLPELCSTGYKFESKQQARDLSESLDDSVLMHYLETFCSKHKLHIVAGINERDGDKLYNSSVLVGPDGYIGKYRKMHLFWDEYDLFKPGDVGLPVFDIGHCKIGMLICFDWLFPEAWRILALKGADLICHPSNLVLPGLCQRSVPTHAVCNRVYIVTANRVGSEENLNFTGRSIVVAPNTDVLLEASPAGEETGLVDIDISVARDKNLTPRNHALTDRRPDQYGFLTE